MLRTIAETREALGPLRSGSIGLVPTMGALHDGHRAVHGGAENEAVVMSLFVNPAQFAEGGDLARYPRDEARDLELAGEAGVDVVFAPSRNEMYPPGFQTWVDVTEVGSILEGRFRPGHFRGVATVVLEASPSRSSARRAYFGQKDAQQVEVIRTLIRDLALEVELRVVPIVRDLTASPLVAQCAALAGRAPACARAPRALATGDRERALAELAAANGLEIDYVEVADFDPPVLAGAVRVGSTRLIDNVVLEGERT